MLTQTLQSLEHLMIPKDCEVTLLLIDNAPHDPIEHVYQTFKMQLPFPSLYFQEHTRGIVHMRNRILQEALNGNYDYLAFIDDDEIVRPDWLDQMYSTMIKYGADVISGRTIRQLPIGTPQWIRDGGFYEKGMRPTGIQRPTSSTCNVLFDIKKLCESWEMQFDVRLNLVGSSDILFFNQAHKKGAKIIWANEAVVEEIIPESRATKTWILQRAYRIGNTMAVRLKIQHNASIAYLKGIGFVISELFTYLTYQVRLKRNKQPEIQDTKKRHHLNIAKGILNGFFGKSVFEEYKQHHGY